MVEEIEGQREYKRKRDIFIARKREVDKWIDKMGKIVLF